MVAKRLLKIALCLNNDNTDHESKLHKHFKGALNHIHLLSNVVETENGKTFASRQKPVVKKNPSDLKQNFLSFCFF